MSGMIGRFQQFLYQNQVTETILRQGWQINNIGNFRVFNN